MTNNTTSNETTNETTNVTTTETVDSFVDSLMDTLAASPELLALAGVALGGGAYTYLKVPAVRNLVDQFLRKHNKEVDGLLSKYLTKAQQVAYEKLDAKLQKEVKNQVIRNVILSEWDHRDDKAVSQVRTLVRKALTSNK